MLLDIEALPAWAPAVFLVVLALTLRLAIHLGKTPGGVDTWYFLSYVRELHRAKRFPVRLPRYLLQDVEQTYPPLFPLFLALFPIAFLERWFWLVSPLLDVMQMLLLYAAAFKITGSVSMAALAGLIYAVTPQLIAENRNLNSRAFASLLNSIMMLALFRATVVQPSNVIWFIAALLVAVALLMAHKLTTQAFVFTSAVLSVVWLDWRYAAFAAVAFVTAEVLSLGFYGRVLRAHIELLDVFRRQNVKFMGTHHILDSPLYGQGGRSKPRYYEPGLRGHAKLFIRLLGENPFILAMLVSPRPNGHWDGLMYWWAVSVLAWSFLTTFVPALRMFGQGHLYMKLSVFPTAYTLALDMASGQTALAAQLALVLCFVLSAVAVAYLYRYHRGRRTEHTNEIPDDLKSVACYLTQRPDYAVMCLPLMYADYLVYSTQSHVYWGGHHSGLHLLDGFFPVVTIPIEEIVQGDKNLLVLDTHYLEPAVLRLDGKADELARFGSFCVYRFRNHDQFGAAQSSEAVATKLA